MDVLEKSMYVTMLFDTYQGLLTEKQKAYIHDYYYDDLSLQEIAENRHVSRNAVYDQVKKTVKKLESYEASLRLCDKLQRQQKILAKFDDLAVSKEVQELIEELKKVE